MLGEVSTSLAVLYSKIGGIALFDADGHTFAALVIDIYQ